MPSTTANPEQSVSTSALYEQWASTYDTDGNILQAVDDAQLADMLPSFLNGLLAQSGSTSPSDTTSPRNLRLLDLGCGTGRNTLKLLQHPWPAEVDVEISAWDSSPAMLALAERKYSELLPTLTERKSVSVRFEQVDVSALAASNSDLKPFDAIISTLVLEHLPVKTFFSLLSRLAAPRSTALLTNMHPEMGARTRAGFPTADGGRIRGESYVHTVKECVDAAATFGLEAEGSVRETAVDDAMIEKEIVGARGPKWVGIQVWFGMVLRKAGG